MPHEQLDVSHYVDLTVDDREPDDLVAQAVELLEERLPDWVPNEASIEVMLYETIAEIIAELIFTVNRLPGAVVESLLLLHGLERDAGSPPTVDVRFDVSDDFGHDIPAGTALLLSPGQDTEPLEFRIVDGLAIPSGQTSGVATAEGIENTSRANGTPAGTPLELLDAIAFVDRAETDTDSTVTGGVDPEDSDAFLDRGRQRLDRLTETLVLPDHFVSFALENPEIGRAFAIDMYDPGTANAPGDDPGHMTVVATDVSGQPLSVDVKDTLNEQFNEAQLAALVTHVADPSITTVDVDVTVTRHEGYDPATVATDVENAIRGYLDPAQWGWSDTVRRYELISLIDGVDGVDWVATLIAPADDVALTGHGPLAIAGTVNVTVDPPS